MTIFIINVASLKKLHIGLNCLITAFFFLPFYLGDMLSELKMFILIGHNYLNKRT